MQTFTVFRATGLLSCAIWLTGSTGSHAQVIADDITPVPGGKWDHRALRASFRSDAEPRDRSVRHSTLWAAPDSGTSDDTAWNAIRERELHALLNPRPQSSLVRDFVEAAVGAVDQMRLDPLAGGAPTIRLDFGSPTIQLTPNTAGQTVGIFLANTGSAVDVFGLDLGLSITGASTPRPAFSASNPVNLQTGTVFTGGNSAMGAPDPNSTPQLGFWSVSANSLVNLPHLPATSNSGTQIGTVTFDTTGVGPGEWTLNVLSQSALVDLDGNEYQVSFVGATLQVVPEPGATLAFAGCLLGGWAFVRRRYAVAA